jgi:hypothetical protein
MRTIEKVEIHIALRTLTASDQAEVRDARADSRDGHRMKAAWAVLGAALTLAPQCSARRVEKPTSLHPRDTLG